MGRTRPWRGRSAAALAQVQELLVLQGLLLNLLVGLGFGVVQPFVQQGSLADARGAGRCGKRRAGLVGALLGLTAGRIPVSVGEPAALEPLREAVASGNSALGTTFSSISMVRVS